MNPQQKFALGQYELACQALGVDPLAESPGRTLYEAVQARLICPPPARLAYSGKELRKMLGVSTVTLWRLEKRGRLRPVPGIRHKLYSVESVQALLK